MAAQSLLAASAYLERGLWLAAMGVATGLALLAMVPRPPGLHSYAWLRRRQEGALLAVILVGAAFMRVAGWDRQLSPPFSFSHKTTLYVADLLDGGTLWQYWLDQFTHFQAGAIETSALVLPVSAAFQVLLGPSFHLPLLVGAFYGLTAPLFAWLLGRAAVSKGFGLAFAAFVAASPLQLVWSRLGGVMIPSVTHVLLTLWCAFAAGKRRSWLLAVVTGAAIWGSLYHYYAARVALPLGFFFLVAGLRHSRAPLKRALGILAVASLTVALIYAVARPPSPTAFWPEYRGYVGNQGERSLGDFVRQNLVPLMGRVPVSLWRYFLADRATSEPAGLQWGMQSGGLCLAPVGLLGCLGLGRTLRRFGRGWPWLLLAAAGLAIPLLSTPTARRFLVFDVAWCALAAHGLLALLRFTLARALSARLALGFSALALALLAAWSFASMVALNAVLSPRHGQVIPFGESGFGDGLTCLRCLRAGHEWRDGIARGQFVVLFDTDVEREDATSPGALPLYGEVAALTAGRQRNFVEFYPVMANFATRLPHAGPFFDASRTDFASYMIGRLKAAGPTTILWHFERPTQWERWLARRLIEAGGRPTEFATPLSTTPGLQVRTGWADRRAVFSLLSELARRGDREDERCPALHRVARTEYPFLVLTVAGGGDEAAGGPPDWIVGSWGQVAYREATFDNELPTGGSAERAPEGGAGRLHLLWRPANETVYELGDGKKTIQPVPLPETGLGCAVRIGSEWWMVDPTTGEVATTDPAGGWVPAARWAGIARQGADRIVLASADQYLAVFDVPAKREIQSFPAAVWPSRKVWAGECSPVVAGEGWYATLNHLTSLLTVYDAHGGEAGSRDLGSFLGIGRRASSITAWGAAASHLAIGYADVLATVEVSVGPECVDERSRSTRPRAVGDEPS